MRKVETKLLNSCLSDNLCLQILRCGPPPMNKAIAGHCDALGYTKEMQFQFWFCHEGIVDFGDFDVFLQDMLMALICSGAMECLFQSCSHCIVRYESQFFVWIFHLNCHCEALHLAIWVKFGSGLLNQWMSYFVTDQLITWDFILLLSYQPSQLMAKWNVAWSIMSNQV